MTRRLLFLLICFSRRLAIGLAGALLVASVLAVVTARLWLPAIGSWLARPSQLNQADAIVVLSGGGPERLIYGITLYQQGLAPELWYTGDVPIPTMTSFTDGQFARQFAIGQNVPAGAIHLLETTSTWEDGQQIAAAVRQRGLHRLLIVTNWYHSRRALCVIQGQLTDMDVYVFYSSPPAFTYTPDDWWRRESGLVAVVNELIKFGFYWWHYGLAPWGC
jgi:uncharacterized SAM-binding protein YcdF (DUF218 family)